MDGDRSWMMTEGVSARQQAPYRKGVKEFLDFAFRDSLPGARLKCPCRSCQNHFCHTREAMRIHLFTKGIEPSYNPWIHHGEEDHFDLMMEEGADEEEEEYDLEEEEDDPLISDEIISMVHDATNVPRQADSTSNDAGGEARDEPPESFQRLMKAAQEELYSGCKTFSRLEFIVTLLHLKVSGRWSEKSFTGLLGALHKAFNYDPNFPKTSHEAKKYTKDLGLNYVKIHACVNHCVLYRKEYADLDSCPTCKESRWEEGVAGMDDSGTFSESQGLSQTKSKIPRHVLRYFPLAPRLQRFFMSSKLASHMRWHKEKRKNDGVLRHPADSKAWKNFDEQFPDFAGDARNVRLGLATDGFNPGLHTGTKYSIWPVFLVPYNLPPLLCMRSPYLMLSLLIPGPRSPGNDLDVFLEPLVDELKTLWEDGVQTYDAHSGKTFNMKAALMWTMSDYPAYANLSGWSTCGKLACAACQKETSHNRLDSWGKECFLGHRRFLDADHRWRYDARSFNGEYELRPSPIPLSGDEILEKLSGLSNVTFGKPNSLKRKRDTGYLIDQWKKLSIFFKLPYWSKLLIRHNFDIMHIEKNVCDNILGTVLGIPGKSKDGLNARLDLVNLNMHKKLRATKVGDKYSFPKAPYQLTLPEKRQVASFLSKVKVPDGYASNISRCASLGDGRITDMKSHDCHIFMEELMIPTFRGILPKEVFEPLAELSLFFKQLHSKALTFDALEKLDKSIAVTLCKLEKIFVPAFFDISVHLPIHLAKEAMLAGPVQSRSMWRFEREMRTLKSNVGNKARPEASIAEAEIQNECLTFCSRYLSGVETKFDRWDRNDVDEQQPSSFSLSIFQKKGSPLGKMTFKELSHEEWKQAHIYVLRNCLEVQPFFEEFGNVCEGSEDFVDWFKSRIWNLHKDGDSRVTKELLSLSQGPRKSVLSYQGYFVNGYRFHTKRRERRRKTQNSGVIVKGDAKSGEKDFFGVLKEVIELEYDAPKEGGKEPVVVLFRCYWFDVYGGGQAIRTDKYGTISININKQLRTNEPYALASQVGQVYYVRSHNEPNWRIVIKTIPRNFYYAPTVEDDCDEEVEHIREDEDFIALNEVQEDQGADYVSLPRCDVPNEVVTVTVNRTKSRSDVPCDVPDEDDSSQDDESELEELDVEDFLESSSEEDEDYDSDDLDSNSD